tara:strand:- start:3873 stop:4310 length:438 start_codon:yes stop_codon:yes gene_type:complete
MDYIIKHKNIDVSLYISNLNAGKTEYSLKRVYQNHIESYNYDSIRNLHVHCSKKLKKECKYKTISSDSIVSDDIIRYFKPCQLMSNMRHAYKNYSLTEVHIVHILYYTGYIVTEYCYLYQPNDIAGVQQKYIHLLLATDVSHLEL